MRLKMSEYDGEGGRNQQAVHDNTSRANARMINCLLGLQIRNDSSPVSDSIAPFGFDGQPSMWTKEIGKCYQPSLDQSSTVRKTDTCVLLRPKTENEYARLWSCSFYISKSYYCCVVK